MNELGSAGAEDAERGYAGHELLAQTGRRAEQPTSAGESVKISTTPGASFTAAGNQGAYGEPVQDTQ